MAEESKSGRMAVAREHRRKQQRIDRLRQQAELDAGRRTEALIAAVAAALAANDLDRARAALAAGPAAGHGGDAGAIAEIRDVLDKAAGIEARILDSFRAQTGKKITVYLSSGRATLVVKEVRGGQVWGRTRVAAGKAHADRVVHFGPDDLSARERLRRMGSDDAPEVALAKGMMALDAQAYGLAVKYFSRTHPRLVGPLASAVRQLRRKRQ
jgi:hypothetical protein